MKIGSRYPYLALCGLLFITLAASPISSLATPQNGDEDDKKGFQIIGEDSSKDLGLFAGPLFFLGGCYILFMWTRRLFRYLLVEWGDLIGLNTLDEEQVKAAQRKIKPWLLWVHITGMGLAFAAAGIHAYGQYLDEGAFEGGLFHLLIWPALLVLALHILTGLDLKFRVLPNSIRRRIRPLHKNPIIVLAIALIILGHVFLMGD